MQLHGATERSVVIFDSTSLWDWMWVDEPGSDWCLDPDSLGYGGAVIAALGAATVAGHRPTVHGRTPARPPAAPVEDQAALRTAGLVELPESQSLVLGPGVAGRVDHPSPDSLSVTPFCGTQGQAVEADPAPQLRPVRAGHRARAPPGARQRETPPCSPRWPPTHLQLAVVVGEMRGGGRLVHLAAPGPAQAAERRGR